MTGEVILGTEDQMMPCEIARQVVADSKRVRELERQLDQARVDLSDSLSMLEKVMEIMKVTL